MSVPLQSSDSHLHLINFSINLELLHLNSLVHPSELLIACNHISSDYLRQISVLNIIRIQIA